MEPPGHCPNLVLVRFLRRGTAEKTVDEVDETADEAVADSAGVSKAHTPGKGKPTPRRRDAEGRKRGPVPPPPKNNREAIRRSRANKTSRDQRRQAAKERRSRMMAGDDQYLMPRDRGPVKAYIRDVVDSRRNLMGLFMPLAILVFVALLIPNFAVQQYATLLCLLMLVMMVVEGIINGMRITNLVRKRFPKETVRGLSVGWYAFIRASQLRKLRVPKARIRPGQPIPD